MLEKIQYFDPLNGSEAPVNIQRDVNRAARSTLTDDLRILSTLHGRARRELRDISKQDLENAVKYGIKTPGRTVNGEKRWKFEFGGTIFITDELCTKEITCYKKAIKIEPELRLPRKCGKCTIELSK